MKKYTYILALFVIMLSACKKDEVIGGTAVQDMSGEWWVQIDGEGGYYQLITYNTADNSSTQMWMDASGFWAGPGQHVSSKINVNVQDLTFSAENAPNVGEYESDEPLTMTITNGKIIKNGATGPSSKAVTDSISLTIKFSDDPDSYNLRGYHRTKFSGDDH